MGPERTPFLPRLCRRSAARHGGGWRDAAFLLRKGAFFPVRGSRPRRHLRQTPTAPTSDLGRFYVRPLVAATLGSDVSTICSRAEDREMDEEIANMAISSFPCE